jgi:hypothetical protein
VTPVCNSELSGPSLRIKSTLTGSCCDVGVVTLVGVVGGGTMLGPEKAGDRLPELFPIPCVVGVTAKSCDGKGRGTRQRRRRGEGIGRRVESCVVALNELYSGQGGQPPIGVSASIAQSRVRSYVRRQVGDQLPPADILFPDEALKQLLGSSDYSGVRQDLRPYCAAQLSVPSTGQNAVPLLDLLNDEDATFLRGPDGGLLRSRDEYCLTVETEGRIVPYMCPSLKNRKLFMDFLRQLTEGGMLTAVDHVLERVTPFFVTKKGDRIRLVLDARASNQHFVPPKQADMGSATALSNLVVGASDDLFAACSDLKDCFYSMVLPAWLCPFFCLPDISRAEAISVGLDVSCIHPSVRVIHPALRVLPMGFSHAVYFCQRAHEHILIRSGVVSPARKLTDFSPSPSFSSPRLSSTVDSDTSNYAWLAYVDNSMIISTSQEVADSIRRRCDDELRRAGLLVHEVTAASTTVETLGVVLDGKGGTVGPSCNRLWKLYQSLTAILDGALVSSHDLRIVVGHLTFLWCFNRALLCIPHATYRFIDRGFLRRCRPWSSVLRELRWARDTLFLTRQFIKLKFCSNVIAVDACESGFGVVNRVMSPSFIRRHGVFNERWRFRDVNHRAPRTMALETMTCAPTVEDVSNSTTLNHLRVMTTAPDFSGSDIGTTNDWRIVASLPYKDTEAIHLLEARAIIWGLRRMLKDVDFHQLRHLLLSDNFACVFAFARGRACSRPLLQQIRRASALVVASGSRITYRWIVSELNPADSPSRRFEWKHNALVPYRKAMVVDASAVPAEGGHQSGYNPQPKSLARKDASGGRDSNVEARGCRDFRSDGGRLPPQVVGLCSLVQDGSSGVDGGCANAGWPIDQVHERALRCRIRGGRRPKAHLGLCTPPPGLEKTVRQQAATSDKSVGRLAEVMSSRVDHSSRLGSGGVVGDHHGAATARPGDVGDSIPRCLSEASRGPESQSTRCNSTDVDRGPLLYDLGQSQGVAVSVQDRMFRRWSTAGQEGDARALSDVVPKNLAEEAGAPQDLGHLIPRVFGSLQGGGGGAESLNQALCLEAFGAFPRQNGGRKEHSRDHSPRPLADRSVSSALREVGSSHRGVESSATNSKKICTDQTQQTTPISAGASLGTPTTEKMVRKSQLASRLQALRLLGLRKSDMEAQWTLELFSGQGRWSSALERQGFKALRIDVQNKVSLDLSRPSVVEAILVLIDSGVVKAVHVAPPCSTWSRARRPALRSRQFLYGLPNLSARQQQQVLEANRLARHTLLVVKSCALKGIITTIENPQSSMLWELPDWKQELLASYADIDLDQCQFGAAWKKPTKWRCFNLFNVSCLALRCTSSHICSASGKEHVILRGRCPGSNIPWTRVAQSYPFKLCHFFASFIKLQVLSEAARWKL